MARPRNPRRVGAERIARVRRTLTGLHRIWNQEQSGWFARAADGGEDADVVMEHRAITDAEKVENQPKYWRHLYDNIDRLVVELTELRDYAAEQRREAAFHVYQAREQARAKRQEEGR